MTSPLRDRDRLGATRANLSEDIASGLRDLIVSGELDVGTRLRVDQLARAFGTSLTPAREALISLHRDGFLGMEPRRGYVVAPLSKRDLEDVFDLQAYVAGRLAGRAATNLSPEQVKQLRQLQEQIEAAEDSDDAEQVAATNHQLHRLINLAGDSDKLAWLLRLLTRYVPHRSFGAVKTWQHPDRQIHRSILKAIEKRDAEKAEERMRAHILKAGQALIDYLDSIGHFEAPETTKHPDADALVEKIRSALS